MGESDHGISVADLASVSETGKRADSENRRGTAVWRAILATGLLAWVVAYGVMNNPGAIALFAQSDTLLPADWVHDLARFPGDWRWFKLAQIISFFPDLVMYPLAQALAGSWRAAMVLYATEMAVAMAVLGGLVASLSSGQSRISGITAVSGILALIFACSTLVGRSAALNYSPAATEFPESIWIFALLPVTHGGPFLLSIFTAWWVSGWIYTADLRDKRWQLTGLMAVGVASDAVFIVECAIPMIAVILLQKLFFNLKYDIIRFTRYVVSGCKTGFVITLFVYHGSLPKIAFAKFSGYVKHWASDFLGLPPVWLALVLLLIPVICAIRDFQSRTSSPSPNEAERQFMQLFGIAAAMASLAGCAVMYIDAGIYRYALAWVWWPVILAVGSVLRLSGNRPRVRQPRLLPSQWGSRQNVMVLPAILAAMVIAVAPPKQANALIGWHSRVERCLVGVRAARQLHAGLANYSLARAVAASMSFKWQIDQIDERGAVRPWGNDTKSYFRDFDHPSRPPQYDYLLVSPDMNTQALEQVYGHPDHIDSCPLANVWSWQDPNHVRPLLMANARKLNGELRKNFLSLSTSR